MLCRIATYSNRNTYEYRWNAQKERINLNQVEQWSEISYFYYSNPSISRYLNDWERMQELFTYRFGYLKLAPLRTNEQAFQAPQLLSGYFQNHLRD